MPQPRGGPTPAGLRSSATSPRRRSTTKDAITSTVSGIEQEHDTEPGCGDEDHRREFNAATKSTSRSRRSARRWRMRRARSPEDAKVRAEARPVVCEAREGAVAAAR